MFCVPVRKFSGMLAASPHDRWVGFFRTFASGTVMNSA